MKFLAALIIIAAGVPSIVAQTAALNGHISDESGAIVPGAKVTLRGPAGLVRNVDASPDGAYGVAGLPPGDYSIAAAAPQLMAPKIALTLRPGVQTFDLQLRIATTAAEITVNATAEPVLSTTASSNASATVITGNDLQSLADDPDDLEADLQALAGPSAGPDGNEIFIDGFSGGQLPPKQSIREIRLNQNPFAPEYDKLGLGRIEIFTKPGTDAWHTSLGYNFGTDGWNSRNPYAAQKAPFLLQETENNFSGPISKRTSFTLDLNREAVDNGSVSNGVTLNPQSLAITPFTSTQKTPQREFMARPHIDYQLGENNFLAFTYTYARVNIADDGIGAFDLISRGYHLRNNFDTAQFIETSVHGSIVNETHVQFSRWGYATTANTPGPFIQVLGAFDGGAASTPHNRDIQTASEVHNTTSIVHGSHVIRAGVRLRFLTDDSYWLQGFNGTFTFTGALAPELNANNQPVLDANGSEVMTQISAIEQYRRTLLFDGLGYTPAGIRTLGGGASQFTITDGNPHTWANRFDIGEYVGDDWRVRSNFTLNLGLRFESQNNINDHFDVAPRLGFAWAPGSSSNKQSNTVVRGGYGIFYTRLGLADSVLALRYNGDIQHQYVITNPDFFPNVPPIASLGAGSSQQSIQEIDGNFHSPYLMQGVVTVERQLLPSTTLAATYTNIHGLHTFRSEDINAPLPGTYSGPGTGTYPYPGQGPIFVETSSGLYNQNQLSFNLNSKLNAAASFYITYTFNRSMSNADNVSTFPANPWSMAGEYGPAFNDVRHRLLFGGSFNTKWNLRFNPLLTFQTGMPFNITTGNDPYGTTLFNGRPGIGADPSKPGLIQTPYGLLDPNPTPGEQIIGRNFGRGPFLIQTNLRISRTWGFGRETSPASGGSSLFANPAARRYSLTVGMSARNLINHNNPGTLIGNITSPLFGQANQIAGNANSQGFFENANNRRLELQIRFAF
ncbi:MAG TPA: carboxypeptidase regulatory-like domain-containing protein [Bryobacteraceae bacterium]|nr:carboxypeptidase regulatory-like domain-containing protein [Bryobacteraceae bacterium]